MVAGLPARGAAAEQEDPARSRQAYERALSLDPSHVSARLNLGRLLHETSQLEDFEANLLPMIRASVPAAPVGAAAQV